MVTKETLHEDRRLLFGFVLVTNGIQQKQHPYKVHEERSFRSRQVRGDNGGLMGATDWKTHHRSFLNRHGHDTDMFDKTSPHAATRQLQCLHYSPPAPFKYLP